MGNTEQNKLILKHQKVHSNLEDAREKASIESGKNLNEAQYKKDKAISDDAYPDNAHFIYEIIQNAEDSSYKKNKKAELEFHLLNDGILVLSNQDGFQATDIDSICYMASGGKIAKKDQFIGEKGLGFRSVFKITNTPCISSNGYEFYFDREQSYEKPFLLKDYQKPLPDEFKNYENTAIFLPYSIIFDEINELENDFQSKIKPKLILFLKKLNSISIIKNNKKYMFIEKESSKSENFELSKLKDNNNKQEFYITRKTINVSNLNEDKRKNIKEREIVLAYPKVLEESSSNIFAFLPTDINSRLNFTIQADFLLDTSRGQLLENQWNNNIFKEIKLFIIDNIHLFQNHSKLKFEYLKYYLQETKSNNKFIDNLYSRTIHEIRNKNLILSTNETWQRPNNIILLEGNIQIDTQYLKLLFGDNYEQVHKKFELNDYFKNEFKIKTVDKKEIIEAICSFFDKKDLNDYNQNIVLELTKFLAKNLSTDSRALTYEKSLFDRIKESLPIIPKYKTNKKFYLFDRMYISSEYKPKFIIENIAKEDEFDFTEYNFLSNDYLKDSTLTNFIKNIIDEQEKHNNKKTIEFFSKYPNILHNYLSEDINMRYKKLLDFLIEIQEDNKDKISKIRLLMVKNGDFYNATQTIYFSHESDDDLQVLDENLFKLIQSEHRYKEFFEKIFKVKEADILNIILNEHLPWIQKNYQTRNNENDKKLLNYTKEIIENFDKFEKENKDKIKQSLFFISSNQENRYLKSSNLYLSQNLTEIIFERNSIERYIKDKSYFDFLDTSYDSILEKIDEENIKSFFKFLSFEKNIKESDIVNFIKVVKEDLDLDSNIEALKFITQSIDSEDRKKIKDIENFKVYSQNDNLIEMGNIFQEQIADLKIDYLHKSYTNKIQNKSIQQYFQSEYKIEPFIDYLKKDIDFKEAIKVYQYLERKSDFNPNKKQNNNYTITTEKIRKEFKKNKLIYKKNGEKLYPSDVIWKEEKSNSSLFALSTIYPPQLQNFFIETIQISQTKDIKLIIKEIRKIKEKSDKYFNLLIDLNNLVGDKNELYKYHQSYNGSIHEQYDNNIYENAKQFILKGEGIFILDDGKKNTSDNFYFNDLDIDNYPEKIENKIFSVNKTFPIKHYDKLINILKIKRLNDLEKSYGYRQFKEHYNIEDYRLILHFAYDLLFKRFKEKYDKLEDREKDLKELNSINTINIHQDIISQIKLDGIRIELDAVKYYFKNDQLYITNEDQLFKIISEKIGSISDKDIDHFNNKVIRGNTDKKTYYEDEDITEKQNFGLDISDIIIEHTTTDTVYDDNSEEEYNTYNNNDTQKDTHENYEPSAEEKRNQRNQRMKESLFDNDRGNGQTNEFEDAQNKETTIQDNDEYLHNIDEENENNEGKYTSYNTNERKQDKESLVKVEEFLYKEYEGHCQICGDTFSDGVKNISVNKALNIGKNRDIKRKGNTISLCHKHYEIFKRKNLVKHKYLDLLSSEKNIDENYIETKYEKYDWVDKEDIKKVNDSFYRLSDESEFIRDDVFFLPIQLFKREEYIKFTKAHMIEFISVWNNH